MPKACGLLGRGEARVSHEPLEIANLVFGDLNLLPILNLGEEVRHLPALTNHIAPDGFAPALFVVLVIEVAGLLGHLPVKHYTSAAAVLVMPG